MNTLTRVLGCTLLLLAFVDTAMADGVSVRLGNTTFNGGSIESTDIGNTRFYPDGGSDSFIGGYEFHHDAPAPRVRPPDTQADDSLYQSMVRDLWND